MSLAGDIKTYARFARSLRGYLKERLTLEEARQIVQRRMAEREANFLRLVRKGIFGQSRSPYLHLIKLARCEVGDVENMVRTKGVESTLHALREAGVYIRFEEFKGREPIVRNGQVFPVKASHFDNPYLSRYYYTETGGTTGAGTRIMADVDHWADRAPQLMLALDAHRLLGVPMAMWRSILPGTGLSNILLRARFGQVPMRWFSPLERKDLRSSIKYRLATEYIVLVARLSGVPIPRPETVRLDEAALVARWAASTLKAHRTCLVSASVSMAVRVCLAAKEEGLDMTGVVFWGGGEQPTPAKVQRIKETGARFVPSYWMAEAGPLGLGCVRPADENDHHFMKDSLAIIQHPCEVPGVGMSVDAFYTTSLLPTTPKLMLNVETDDYGILEQRSCGCPLETYGFSEHVRAIRSMRKLTGEGMTLVGSEMIHILEEVLPSRFGGSPLDYQILEEEDKDGITRVSLLVSPKLKISDESAVIQTVLEALGKGSRTSDLVRATWSQAGTLRIKRMDPIWTGRGKLMTLHVKRGQEKGRS